MEMKLSKFLDRKVHNEFGSNKERMTVKLQNCQIIFKKPKQDNVTIACNDKQLHSWKNWLAVSGFQADCEAFLDRETEQ